MDKEQLIYYTVANFKGFWIGRICKSQAESLALAHELEKEGIPCFVGEADRIDIAHWQIKEAIGLPTNIIPMPEFFRWLDTNFNSD